jgi:hypothetical protein
MSFELRSSRFVMMWTPRIDIRVRPLQPPPRDAKGRAALWIVAYQNWRCVDAAAFRFGGSRTVQKPPAHSDSANGCTALFEVPESCGQSNRMASRCMEGITDGSGKASRPFLT